MADVTPVPMVEVAVSLLIEQYKNSTDLINFLTVIADAGMDIQTAVFEIRERFVLSTAVKAELTIIGKVWDVPRGFNSDTELRNSIKAKISVSVSGTITEIEKAILTIYGGTFVEYHPTYPAGYFVRTDAAISQTELEKITVAGVMAVILLENPGGNYIKDSDSNYIVGSNGFPIIDHRDV